MPRSDPRHPAAIAELQRRGLSYRDAAPAVGLSHAHLWKVLHGDKPLLPHVRDRLERVLLLPLDDD